MHNGVDLLIYDTIGATEVADLATCMSLPSAPCYRTLHGLSRLSHSVVARYHWVRRWFASLCKEGYLLRCRLRIRKTMRRLAYMDDGGNVWVSWGLLFASCGAFVKYVMHETAHLWLSQCANYDDLLAADRRYFAAHGRGEDALRRSPVECYATMLSIRIMQAAAEAPVGGKMRRLLREQIAVETQKQQMSNT